MPSFKNGTVVNSHPTSSGNSYNRLRISAGPQRAMYLDKAILEAKLGRKLRPGMTAEHKNGDSLDLIGEDIGGKLPGDNLIEVTQAENNRLMFARRSKRKKAKAELTT